MLAYIAIVSMATAAYFSAPIWTVLIGAVALMLLSVIEHRNLAANFSKSYATSTLTWAAWQSAGHAALASSAAYLLGYLTRLSF
jgi:hypothetical protein